MGGSFMAVNDNCAPSSALFRRVARAQWPALRQTLSEGRYQPQRVTASDQNASPLARSSSSHPQRIVMGLRPKFD